MAKLCARNHIIIIDFMSKKLHIETYGCQMNVADSEVVAAIMEMAGYELTDVLEDADAVFLNTCSIRDNAEQKIILHALSHAANHADDQPAALATLAAHRPEKLQASDDFLPTRWWASG